jgi:flagellar biosynthesis/type III secretory pathway M-ring protein FliF/YscJ
MLSFDTTSIWGIILMLTLVTLFVVIWYSYREIVYCRKKIEELADTKENASTSAVIEEGDLPDPWNAFAYQEDQDQEDQIPIPELFEPTEEHPEEPEEHPEEPEETRIEILEEKPKKKGRKAKKIEEIE